MQKIRRSRKQKMRRLHWIECDYKHLEHGFMETEPNAGLCCSNCRTAFQKKKMTYKQYCAACGAKMDGGADNG
jgi:protein-arginine kinase activator protein McsA